MNSAPEIRFDGWTLRIDSGELARHGTVARLQDQPLQVLLELLAQPGGVVTRERLIARLWPKGVVDYETGLNTVVRKLRGALGDHANSPRYIETIPRRGYRFIGTVEPRSASPLAGPATMGFAPPVANLLARQGGQPIARSLAVLPFKPLLPDSANPSFQLGMADTLITRLSVIPGLRVSPLTSVRPFDDPGRDPLEAGSALGVDTVLEGSLQADAQRLRVSARLLKTADGQALWSGEFNEPIAGLFELQDTVARKVVAALAVRLSPELSARLARPAATSAAAYQQYASGLYLWHQRRPEAAGYFEAALREDPQYALAWSGLASALAAQAVYGYAPPGEVFPRAKQAALKALALEPGSAAAHVALGHLFVQYERRYLDGEREYLASLRLDPDNPTTWMRLALVRASMGRLDEALDDMQHARDLEPLALVHATNVAMLRYLKRDFAWASAELDRILALDPGFDPARALRGRVHLAEGDANAAIEQFSMQRRPVPGGDGDLGRAYAQAGRVQEARAEIERLNRRAAEGFGVAYDLAGIHAALGDIAAACAALQRALADHSQLLGFLGSDPAMDALKGETCYREALRRLSVSPSVHP